MYENSNHDWKKKKGGLSKGIIITINQTAKI